MMKYSVVSLALFASTISVSSSHIMHVELYKDKTPLETKSGPLKSKSVITFDEGVEVTLVEEHNDYAVVKVHITNDKCPMASGKNQCTACDCCNGCELRCPEACSENSCCEQGCCDSDKDLYEIPFNQTFTIKCPSCQYSLQLTITSQ